MTYPLLSDRSFVGVAAEPVEGQRTPPGSFLRLSSFLPVIATAYQPLVGLPTSGVAVLDQVPGARTTTITAAGSIYPDELGWFLATLLPDIAFAAGMTSFATKNPVPAQPGSLSFTDFDGTACRIWSGCKCSNLTLTFAAGRLALFSAQLTGMAVGDAVKPTRAYSASTALAAVSVAPTLMASPGLAWFTNLTVTITRSLTVVDGGSSNIAGIRAGADLDVSGTATIVYDSVHGRTVQSLFEEDNTVPLTVALGSVGSLQMSAVQLTQASITRPSGQFESLDVRYSALANSTDVGASGGLGPATVTVASSLIYT